MSSSEGPSEGVTVAKTVIEVAETTITAIKAETNGTTTTATTVTTRAVSPSADVVKKVIEAPSSTVVDVVDVTEKVETKVESAKPLLPKPVASKPAATKASPSKTGAAKTVPKATPVKTNPAKATPAKAGPSKDTPAKAPAAKAPVTKTAPPGYKLIKVKNADGKIIIVKKKLTEDEIAAAEKKGEEVKPDNTASEQTKSVEYKIVSIPQSDGTLVKVRRAVHPEDVAGKKKSTTSNTATNKDGKAVAVTEKEDNGVDDDDEPMDEATRNDMIRKQKHKFRMGRSRKYRRKLIRGFAMQLIGELPDIEIDSHGFQDGDQVISDDDSDLDFDSDNDMTGDHHDHDHDHDDNDHDGSDHDHNDHDGKDHDGDKGGFDIKTKKIASEAYDTVATQTQKKKPATTATVTAVPNKSKDGAEDAAPGVKKAPAVKIKATEKDTYKMTDKDLEKLDEHKPVSRLAHSWENFSFYAMASLSVILPMLFVLLAIGATIMNGRLVGSHWDSVSDAIKFAVSVWPIVFAAVVAQCFKTYATYKVERGIKLMQLEQLVGSNSFASAIKQPLLLRRLDLYTLAIFAAWCLSPIGSQALVRVQTAKWTQSCTNSTMWYLSRNGINPVFDAITDGYYKDNNDDGTHLQQATITFNALFDPVPAGDPSTHYYQDTWGNPQTIKKNGYASSVFGTPYFMTDSMFYAADNAAYYGNTPITQALNKNYPEDTTMQSESFEFPIRSSYFSFECDSWQVLSSGDMADKIDHYTLESTDTLTVTTPTYYMAFGYTDDEMESGWDDDPANSPTMMRWGSFNWPYNNANYTSSELLQINDTYPTYAPFSNSTITYSYTECAMEQVYIEYNVSCSITAENYVYGASYECYSKTETIKNLTGSAENHTNFYPFTLDFIDAVKPTQYTSFTTITPFERFLASDGLKFDTLFQFDDDIPPPGHINSSYAYWYNMTNNTTPGKFGETFSLAFNTWMDTGYCPGSCRTTLPSLLLDLSQTAKIPLATEEKMANGSTILGNVLLIPASMFESSVAQWCYTENYVYVIRPAYLVLLYICSVGLLFLGIASVVIESRVVAPDILGYASTVARNSRYLHLPATTPGMSGADRVRKFGGTVVMMQDVKKDADVGKIALGNKKHDSAPLRVDRTYR
ncbi:hypothetical protein SEUCBS140593_008868 [Sporothrix eucalyptigena]|uniref:Uncharacterized protein n=1 Tax=Sporothrix eucalyptigena TaxID=1812306 RepID=A0ABP0CQQ5_9PEZI